MLAFVSSSLFAFGLSVRERFFNLTPDAGIMQRLWKDEKFSA